MKATENALAAMAARKVPRTVRRAGSDRQREDGRRPGDILLPHAGRLLDYMQHPRLKYLACVSPPDDPQVGLFLTAMDPSGALSIGLRCPPMGSIALTAPQQSALRLPSPEIAEWGMNCSLHHSFCYQRAA